MRSSALPQVPSALEVLTLTFRETAGIHSAHAHDPQLFDERAILEQAAHDFSTAPPALLHASILFFFYSSSVTNDTSCSANSIGSI